MGKFGLEIGVYQKTSPIGGSFGEVSESLHLLRSADGRTRKRASPRAQLNCVPHPPKIEFMTELWAIHPYFDLIMSTECPKYNIF